MERRRVLRVAGSAVLAGLAGCSTPFASRPSLDFSVENYRNESVELSIEVIHSDAADRSEALVYQAGVEIPPGAVGDDEWRANDVAPARPYRIEVGVGIESKTYHYHYVPDCTGDDAPYEPRVDLVLNERAGVSFGQTRCQGEVASAP